jgi:hypothetical protein
VGVQAGRVGERGRAQVRLPPSGRGTAPAPGANVSGPKGRPGPELLDAACPDRHPPYLAEWTATKLRWSLTADQSEIDTINVYAGGPCQMTVVHHVPAP